MALRILYFSYVLIVHALIAWLLYDYFEENKWYFLISEIGIFLSLIISYYFFRRFNQPLTLMKYGVDAIKDEDYNVQFLKTGSESINELIDVFNKFLEKLRQERVSAQEQGYFLESIIAASPIGMVMLDYDDLITSFNNAAVDIFGKSQLKEEVCLFNLNHPLTKHLSKLETGESSIIKVNPTQRYRCRMNAIIHLGFKRRFIMIEELSKELLENEKAAYGKVIRMMAHEVNNSMGAVNSILQSVIDFAFDSNENEYIEFLEVAKSRNEDLAAFMKNFAEVIRVPPPNKELIDIVELVKRVQLIMSSKAKESDVKIDVLTLSDPIMILCDASQIQQVLINAIKNAIESIEYKGEIKITLQDKKPQLKIIDNGPGIQEHVKEQLFTPFFSTKPEGQGIGLIISREILVSHGAQFVLFTNQETSLTHFEISF